MARYWKRTPEIIKRIEFKKIAYQDGYLLYEYRYWLLDKARNRIIPNRYTDLTNKKPFYKTVYSENRWPDKKMIKMAEEAFQNSLENGTYKLGLSSQAWYGKAKNGHNLGGFHDSALNITTIFFVFKEHLYSFIK